MPIFVEFGSLLYKRRKLIHKDVYRILRSSNGNINGFWHVTIKNKETTLKTPKIPEKISIYSTLLLGKSGECFYCKEKYIKLTKDHFYPKSKGGTLTVLCCSLCNKMKKDYTPEQWVEKCFIHFGKKKGAIIANNTYPLIQLTKWSFPIT